jgi:hypothetical protein
VSHSCACIGSPCLRYCVHGASIGRRGGGLTGSVGGYYVWLGPGALPFVLVSALLGLVALVLLLLLAGGSLGGHDGDGDDDSGDDAAEARHQQPGRGAGPRAKLLVAAAGQGGVKEALGPAAKSS